MIVTYILGLLALISACLNLWQWFVGRRFPLHERKSLAGSKLPPITLLKPLKGCDTETAGCLRSWLEQDYSPPLQVLFGVASAADPVVAVVQSLIREYPHRDIELVICEQVFGPNAKVSSLIQIEEKAKYEVLVISDADVLAPPDLLEQLGESMAREVGLINCFYAIAKPVTFAMRWEALAVNADFWSQVLQAGAIKPIDFALGAVMATRRATLQQIGGFCALVDYLADDYQLGNRIAHAGKKIGLSPVVVQCVSAPMTLREVWAHQLRWARTIRACQPIPYFFSILNNATLWPLLLLGFGKGVLIELPLIPDSFLSNTNYIVSSIGWDGTTIWVLLCLLLRIFAAQDLQWRLTQSQSAVAPWWMAPVKDLFQTLLWILAFTGNSVTWRGQTLRITRGGRLERLYTELPSAEVRNEPLV